MEILNKFDKKKNVENKSGSKGGKMQGSKSARMHGAKSKIQSSKSQVRWMNYDIYIYNKICFNIIYLWILNYIID